MAHSNFNLIDAKEKVQKYADKVSSRKLKLKAISWKNISLHWKKFRLEKLRQSLAETKFRESEIKPEHYEKAEKKVMNKAKKIADLEAQITFIETGKKSSMKFLETRALNLKNLMMKNLRSNGEYIYSVSSSVADRIKSGNYMAEEAISQTQQDIPITKPSENIVSNDLVVENTSGSQVDSDNTIEVTSEITKESIREAIEEKMRQLETKESEEISTIVDGEYAFKGVELSEDGRRDFYDIKLLTERLKKIQEKVRAIPSFALINPDDPVSIVKSDKAETKQRYMPVIVENRESSDNSMIISEEKPGAEDNIEEKIATTIAKYKILDAEYAKQASINQSAKQQLSDSSVLLKDKYAELAARTKAREEDCNAIADNTASVYEEISLTEAQIDAIDAILGNTSPETTGYGNVSKRR